MFTFCSFYSNISNWYCSNIYMKYISSILLLHVVKVKPIILKYWPFIEKIPMIYHYRRNIDIRWKYFNVMPILGMYWLYFRNISSEMPREFPLEQRKWSSTNRSQYLGGSCLTTGLRRGESWSLIIIKYSTSRACRRGTKVGQPFPSVKNQNFDRISPDRKGWLP